MRINLKYGGREYGIIYDGLQYIPYFLTSTSSGTVREDRLGFFQSLGNALKKITKHRLGSDEEFVTLQDFIDRYEKALEDMEVVSIEDIKKKTTMRKSKNTGFDISESMDEDL